MSRFAALNLHGRLIRCLLFDLGETLWVHQEDQAMERIGEIQKQTCAAHLQTFAPHLSSQASDYLAWSAHLQQALTERYHFWRCRNYEQEPDPLQITAEACQTLSLPSFRHEQLHHLFEAFRPPLVETRRLLDGARDTLETLKASGLLLGCVTDRHYGGVPFQKDLRDLGLLDYFPPEALVVSADYGYCKPHPSLFLQAMSVLGVLPGETAMVGDFLSRDIAGAKRLHIGAIWKPKERLLQQVMVRERETRQDVLFRLAIQEEEAMYSEGFFIELEPFMKPDALIENVAELPSFLV